MRVVCVEASPDEADDFLEGVVDNLEAAGVDAVRLEALSDDAAVARIAKVPKNQPLESLDLVGHGASGLLHVGATAAGEFNGDLYATLDADLRKVGALEWIHEALAARRKKGGLIDPDFAVRLLGCEVGVDPGELDGDQRLNLADGAVLIHFVASHLDVPVEAPLELIYAEDFVTGQYAGAPTRRCTVRADGRVSFKRVQYGPQKQTSQAMMKLVSAPPPPVPSPRGRPTYRDAGGELVVQGLTSITLPTTLAPEVRARLPKLVTALPSPRVGLRRDAYLGSAGDARVSVAGTGRYVLIERPGLSYLGPIEGDVLTPLGLGQRAAMARAERQRAQLSRLPPDEPVAP
jgi:hypothetical protein